MSHVVGIPLRKGNNQEVISCEISPSGTGRATITEGMAVGSDLGTLKPIVKPLSEVPDGFVGFIFGINKCNDFYHGSLVQAGTLICLPTASAAAFAPGDPIKVNTATGLIDAAGTLVINGTIVATSVEQNFPVVGIDGKTGEVIPECVLVSFGSGRALAAVGP